MKNALAPIVVFLLGSIGFIAVGEPAGISLIIAIALMGYGINKAAN